MTIPKREKNYRPSWQKNVQIQHYHKRKENYQKENCFGIIDRNLQLTLYREIINPQVYYKNEPVRTRIRTVLTTRAPSVSGNITDNSASESSDLMALYKLVFNFDF